MAKETCQIKRDIRRGIFSYLIEESATGEMLFPYIRGYCRKHGKIDKTTVNQQLRRLVAIGVIQKVGEEYSLV